MRTVTIRWVHAAYDGDTKIELDEGERVVSVSQSFADVRVWIVRDDDTENKE